MKLIIIAGPTATGKSKAAVELALRINGEIISADSMQVYKYMDIGTAKPCAEDMKGVRHYLIDELYPDEEFSVAVFQELAMKYIGEIRKKSKTPILVGGTGFYINSVIYGNDFGACEPDGAYRDFLFALARENGNEYIHGMLESVDPESARSIHYNNVKRVVRALEYHKQTGKKISGHNMAERQRPARFDTEMFILGMDRGELYRRIETRVDGMMEAGLVREVSALLEMGYTENLTSMQGIGYHETVKYLKGELTLDEAKELIKRDTKRYAKRQLTWFRHQSGGTWINIDVSGDGRIIVDEIENIYKRGCSHE